MDILWWIEERVFPASAPRMVAAIERHGLSRLTFDDNGGEVPPAGARVVFWGSLGAAYDQRVAARWTPGAIGDPERFRCSVYHAALGPLLANADAVFTTARELVDRREALLRPLGAPARVFVRPDSALKPFAGRQLATDALTLAALDHGFYYDDPELAVVASTVKAIGREWRFVVADGAVVAACEYGDGRQGRGTEVPDAARAVAEEVAHHRWQAAPIFIVDVAEVAGAPRVLELNPFSGADVYDCDADAVVAAATAIAARA